MFNIKYRHAQCRLEVSLVLRMQIRILVMTLLPKKKVLSVCGNTVRYDHC